MNCKKILVVSLCFVMLLASQNAWASGPASTEGAREVDESYDPYYIAQELAANIAEQQLKYAPKVTTLANGVKVQRTPDDDGIYNTYVLKADQRGCAACHSDLRAALNNLPMGHLDICNRGEVDVNVAQCLSCHTYSPGYVPEVSQFGSLLHGLHKSETFTKVGGDCMSCHDASKLSGTMALWDEVKYERLRGILDIKAEDLQAEFSFDQTTQTDPEKAFSLNWVSGASDYMVYDDYVHGLATKHEDLLNWKVSVDGLVEHPFTMTMGEIIDAFPSKTRVMSIHCTLDGATGALIDTFEVTGIPIQALLEKAGVKPEATEVYTVPADEVCSYPTMLDHLKDHDALIVYQINGKDLRYYQGFPVCTWVAGMGAPHYAKQFNKLLVTAEPKEDLYIYQGWVRPEEGRFFNKPNTAIFYTKEGQMITAGEPYTFEGYADAYDDPIVAMEFSMDGGETWKRYETAGAEVGVWVYWRLTFVPAEEGAYVLKARAITQGGLVNEVPATTMVNAKH